MTTPKIVEYLDLPTVCGGTQPIVTELVFNEDDPHLLPTIAFYVERCREAKAPIKQIEYLNTIFQMFREKQSAIPTPAVPKEVEPDTWLKTELGAALETANDEELVRLTNQIESDMLDGPMTVPKPKSVIQEVASKDAPAVFNSKGGGQSHIPVRFDLIDGNALFAMAAVLDEGANKYGANNWRKIEVESHLNHLIMHAYAYLAGDRSDEHLSHIMCRAMFAQGVHIEEESKKQLPTSKEFTERQKNPVVTSELVEHARRELGLIGEEPETVDGYLRIIQAFADMDHSGGSASVAIPTLNALLQFQNLKPITDDPNEWIDHTNISSEDGMRRNTMFQSRRNPEVFSLREDLKYYYLVSNPEVFYETQRKENRNG